MLEKGADDDDNFTVNKVNIADEIQTSLFRSQGPIMQVVIGVLSGGKESREPC